MSENSRFRIPRIWSNQELKKIAHLFNGDIINVSAWQDKDKEGSYYKDYFSNAWSYSMSNYKTDARGYQGMENEIFLDLTADLKEELRGRYDVVFNHTTLEHIFEVDKAFSNLCAMTRDIVITVVPFMQEQHGDYGDYWRFTPLCLKKMFLKNGMEMIYCTFNTEPNTSVYVLAIGAKNPVKWIDRIPRIIKLGLGKPQKKEVAGYNLIKTRNIFETVLNKFI